VDPVKMDRDAINRAAVEKYKAENTRAESTPMYRHKEYTNRKQGHLDLRKLINPFIIN
jgi:hypothetical protein